MEGRDSERDPEVDDWFDEPESAPPRRRRGGRRSVAAEPDGDPWVTPGGDEPIRARRTEPRVFAIGGRTLSSAQVALLGVLAIALLLAILAAAGAFSSGSKPVATPTTVPTTPTVAVTTTATPPVVAPPMLKLPTATVHPNDTGTPVKQLQAALIKLGYLQGKADGIFGPGTKAAVVAFQSASNLTADGIAGAKTLAALKQALLGKTG